MLSPNLTLGLLIQLLERRDADQHVFFDFATFIPTKLDSYRGYYDHLALGYAPGGRGRADGSDIPTVGALLELLRAADGRVYQGWKGGSYRMSLLTPLWVDNPGDCSSTALVGLSDDEVFTVLATRHVP